MKTMWGGFVNDKIDLRPIDDGWGGWGQQRRMAPALFTNRREARRQYQDVRPIGLEELLYVPHKRKNRPLGGGEKG